MLARFSLQNPSSAGRFSRVLEFAAVAQTADEFAESDATLPRGIETVLVVDRGASVRSSLGNSLRRLGYSMLEASTAREATAVMRERDGIDLLIASVDLPDMPATDLAERLHARRPRLKTLYLAGDEAQHYGIAVDALLPPGVSLATLAVRVRQALDAGTSGVRRRFSAQRAHGSQLNLPFVTFIEDVLEKQA